MSRHHIYLNTRRWARVWRRVFERGAWRQRAQDKRSTWPGLFGGCGTIQ